MATVIKNPDNTLTVTFSAKEKKVIQRWAAERGLTEAAQMEEVISAFLQNKANEYRQIDGPTMRDKYDALTATKQAQVDAILNGA